MSENNIILKKLVFDIEVDHNADYENFSNSISQYKNKIIPNLLEEVFSKCLGPHDNMVIDSLTLDVGNFNSNDLDGFLQKFKKKLLDSINSRNKYLDRSRSNEDLIYYYLKNSRFPWWSSSRIKANEFLSNNQYRSVDELTKLVVSNKIYFRRLLSVLNKENTSQILKKMLKEHFAFYNKSVLFFESISKGNEKFLNYDPIQIKSELFISLIQNKTLKKETFNKVFKSFKANQVMDSDFQSKLFSLGNKPFERVYGSDKNFLISLFKNYINFGINNSIGVNEIKKLSAEFGKLLLNNKRELKIIFDSTSILTDPVKTFRFSKILNNENLEGLLIFLLGAEKGAFLSETYQLFENSKTGSRKTLNIYKYLNIIFKDPLTSVAFDASFIKKTLKNLGEIINKDETELLIDLHLNKRSSNENNSHQLEIEKLVFDLYIKKSKYPQEFLSIVSRIDGFDFSGLLSAYEKEIYELLLSQLGAINKVLKPDISAFKDVEEFVFHQIIKSKAAPEDLSLDLLYRFSENTKQDLNTIILLLLKEKYSKSSFKRTEKQVFSSYIKHLLNKANSNKINQDQIIFINDFVSKNKLSKLIELESYNLKDELLASTTLITTALSLKTTDHKQIFDYFFDELRTFLKRTKSDKKLSDYKLGLIIKLEISRSSLNDEAFLFENILNRISRTSRIKINEIHMDFFDHLVKKSDLTKIDKKLFEKISDTFFSFKNIVTLKKAEVNLAYSYIDKIDDRAFRKKIINNYLLNSSSAVLKLKEDNYKDLINVVSTKSNNYLELLNQVLMLLPYQKRIEFLPIFRIKALEIIQNKELTDNEFIKQLINGLDFFDKELVNELIVDNKDLLKNKGSLPIENSTAREQSLIELIKKKNLKQKQPNSKKAVLERTQDDFEYFINLKRELLKDKNGQTNKSDLFDQFKNLEDIINDEESLIQFLEIYGRDYEILIAFTELSFKEDIEKKIHSIYSSSGSIVEDLENVFLALQEKVLLTNLSTIQFKVLLRTFIFKYIADKKGMLNINVSEFTLSFFQELSLENSLNYQSAANFLLKDVKEVKFQKEVIEGVECFLEKNIFEPLGKSVKEDEYYKNLYYQLIKSNELPEWSVSKSIDDADAQDFLKSRVDKGDVTYIIELCEDVVTKSFIAQEFKDEEKEVQFKLLALLESNNAVFSIKQIYQSLVDVSQSTKINYDIFFKKIITLDLWKEKSVLAIFEKLFEGLNAKIVTTLYKAIKPILPAVKLNFEKQKTLDNNSKRELIRYFIAYGKLPKFIKNEFELKLIQSYAARNKSELAQILKEFSQVRSISENFITISSQPYLLELIAQDLKSKNPNIQKLVENILKSKFEKSNFKLVMLLDILIKNFIGKNIIVQKDVTTAFEEVKSANAEVYEQFVKMVKKLIADKEIENENKVFDVFINGLKEEDSDENLIADLERALPEVEQNPEALKALDNNSKRELIRYFLAYGELPKPFEIEMELDLIRTYTTKNKSELAQILKEFSQVRSISENFITISSQPYLLELIAQDLKSKNPNIQKLVENILKSKFEKSNFKLVMLLDILIKNFIGKNIIVQKDVTTAFEEVKSANAEVYEQFVKMVKKLIADKEIENENKVFDVFVKGLKVGKETAVDLLENKNLNGKDLKVTFNEFINQLRYYVEFKSFERSKKNLSKEMLFKLIVSQKSQIRLKKQIHNWAKTSRKISLIMNLFPEGKIQELLNFIHPKQNQSIQTLNSILKKNNLKSIEEYMNTVNEKEFITYVLNLWSRLSLVVASPNKILNLLFVKILNAEATDSNKIINELEKNTLLLNQDEKALLVDLLSEYRLTVEADKKIQELKDDFDQEQETIDDGDSIYVGNAGIIIAWPFISTLFDKLGLLKGKDFVDDYSLQKAILLINYLATDSIENVDENNLALNKILCGADLNFHVDTKTELVDAEMQMCKSLLNAIIMNWEKLKNSSPDTIRTSFFIREGILQNDADDYKLVVDVKAYDLILKTIPWNISMIQTRFMKKRLNVEWKY